MARYIDQQLLNAVSALDTAGTVDLTGDPREVTIYVRFNASTTAGAVAVEEAYDASETGTWANIATVSWAAANRVHAVHIPGTSRAVRTRISTAITGGTVSAWIVAN